MKYLFTFLFMIQLVHANPNWGFYAHKKINKLAIFCLPSPLVIFYKRHLDEIERMAVLPDQRRHSLDLEAARHYIDLDHYSISELKYRSWEEVCSRYSPDTLSAHGIVPWNMLAFYKNLTFAFAQKDTNSIVKLSAELGHYVADAHVPLHTTSNYDGQQTNQVGIHSFWESKIPELLQDELDDWIGPATYIKEPLKACWDWILESHQMLPQLFEEEKQLSESTPDSKKYVHKQRGMLLEKTYTSKYIADYHKRLDNQVEKRYRASIKHVADLWYSAWLEAGEPEFQ
jgi:hypothetical protein